MGEDGSRFSIAWAAMVVEAMVAARDAGMASIEPAG